MHTVRILIIVALASYLGAFTLKAAINGQIAREQME